MDLDEARAVIRGQSHAVLTTLKADGSPQMSPVSVGVHDDGQLLVSSRETAYKVRHLRRDPRVWLCVFPDEFYGRWVQVSGRAQIVSLPDALPGLEDYYRRLSGEHPDWADYREAMRRDRRVLIRIELEHAGPDRSG
jgi:PPOX class probable F420-dependent enzyme